MKTAAEWKTFYREERARLGPAALDAMLDRAPVLEVPPRGALVFPHTRLEITGSQVAAVARAVVRSRATEVLAIGVLHGARVEDAALLRRARAGDEAALGALRRVHGPGVAGDGGHWREEFSLDAFNVLLEAAAKREGVRPPRVIERYPFLVRSRPDTLPGIDELARIADRCPIVATTDPIHHGAGYGTPEAERRREDDPATDTFARRIIEAQLDRLAAGDFNAFSKITDEVWSDFRDAGPALACVARSRGALRWSIEALDLVDYSEALATPRPTWVAGALIAAMTE